MILPPPLLTSHILDSPPTLMQPKMIKKKNPRKIISTCMESIQMVPFIPPWVVMERMIWNVKGHHEYFFFWVFEFFIYLNKQAIIYKAKALKHYNMHYEFIHEYSLLDEKVFFFCDFAVASSQRWSSFGWFFKVLWLVFISQHRELMFVS